MRPIGLQRLDDPIASTHKSTAAICGMVGDRPFSKSPSSFARIAAFPQHFREFRTNIRSDLFSFFLTQTVRRLPPAIAPSAAPQPNGASAPSALSRTVGADPLLRTAERSVPFCQPQVDGDTTFEAIRLAANDECMIVVVSTAPYPCPNPIVEKLAEFAGGKRCREKLGCCSVGHAEWPFPAPRHDRRPLQELRPRCGRPDVEEPDQRIRQTPLALRARRSHRAPLGAIRHLAGVANRASGCSLFFSDPSTSQDARASAVRANAPSSHHRRLADSPDDKARCTDPEHRPLT